MQKTLEPTGRKRIDLRLPFILSVITLLAVFLRFWGITWGLPNSLHDATYHPDELITLGVATMNIDIPTLQLNPHFYNYPTFYLYMASLSMSLAGAWGLATDVGGLYLAARFVSALMGVGAVLFIYGAGRRMYGTKAGILAALIMAIVPLSVVHAHFATVDVPAAFWVSACIYAASRISASSAKYCILAGLFAGFAAGTKYNAGVVVLVPVVALIASMDGVTWRRRLINPKALYTVILAALGFLITTPGALLWPDEFHKGFGFELWHAGHGHGLVFVNTGPGWLYTIQNTFVHGLGIPLTLLTAMGLVYATMKREKHDWPLMAFFFVYFIMISSSEVRFARYAMPLIPVAALLSARYLAEGIGSSWRRLWIVLAAAAVIWTGCYTITIDRLFASFDPREQALAWFEQNVSEDETIGIPTQPWFYTPPFSPGFGKLSRSERLMAAAESDYNLVFSKSEWNTISVLDTDPDYVVISDYELLDAERSEDAKAMIFINTLRRFYHRVESFGDERTIWNPPYYRAWQLPHDMKYMHPTIWVWKRND